MPIMMNINEHSHAEVCHASQEHFLGISGNENQTYMTNTYLHSYFTHLYQRLSTLHLTKVNASRMSTRRCSHLLCDLSQMHILQAFFMQEVTSSLTCRVLSSFLVRSAMKRRSCNFQD